MVVTGDLADCADLGSYRLIKGGLNHSRGLYMSFRAIMTILYKCGRFSPQPQPSAFFSPGAYFTDAVETDEAILLFLTTTIPHAAAGSFSRSSAADTAYET